MQTLQTTSHTIQSSSQQFMLLHRHNQQLTRITESQSQQISILQSQIQEQKSTIIHLRNRVEELELKCSQFRSSEQKVAVVKDALYRDFNKLKTKIAEQESNKQRLQIITNTLKQQLKQRQLTVLQLCLANENSQKQLKRLNHHLNSYKKQNQQLLMEIRQLKISAINTKITSLSEYRFQQNKQKQKDKKKIMKQKYQVLYIPYNFSMRKRNSSTNNTSINNRSRNSGNKTIKKSKRNLIFQQRQRYNMSEFVESISSQNFQQN